MGNIEPQKEGARSRARCARYGCGCRPVGADEELL